MDFDGSLTPPVSPQSETDSEPLKSSPVLVGKQRSLQGNHAVREKMPTPLCKGYPGMVCCKSSIFQFHYGIEKFNEDCYVRRAFLFWDEILLLNYKHHDHNCDETKREVMDVKRCLLSLKDTNESTDMFYEASLHFQNLEDVAKTWTKSSISNFSHYTTVAKKHRKFINEMLAFVSEYIKHSTMQSDDSTTDSIKHILNLMVMMCNQSQVVLKDGIRSIVKDDLEASDFGGTTTRSSPVQEWMHAYIDINCTLLQILPLISNIPSLSHHIDSILIYYENGFEILEHDFCCKLIKNIFAQITRMAIEKYFQLCVTAGRDKGHFIQAVLFNNSPFPCHCLQQLLSLCMHVALKIQGLSMEIDDNKISFDTQQNISLDAIGHLIWKITMSFLISIIQQNKSKSSDSVPQGPLFPQLGGIEDALTFSWWWSWHVCHLFLFTALGDYQPDIESRPSCLPLISRLIRSSLTSCENSHKVLAAHLICYQAISSFWRVSSMSISAGELAQFHQLWCHFSRKLNATFKSLKPGMDKFMPRDVRDMTPSLWLKKCNNCLKNRRTSLAHTNEAVHEDAFNIFHQIFGEILDQGCWTNIKERFFSRLQPVELKKMNEIGLTRLFQLFLTIALSHCNAKMVRDVFAKLLECINLTYLGKTDYRKQKVSLVGLFSCMHVCTQFSVNMELITTKCGKIIGNVCRLFSESDRNLEQHNSLWKVVTCFLQNLSDLCQITSSFNLGQKFLLPANSLKLAFSSTRRNESLVVLEILTNIFSSISSHIKHSSNKESTAGAVVFFTNIANQALPWLKEKATVDETYSEEIVNTVMEVCLILLQIKATIREQPTASVTILSLIEHFGSNIHVKLRTRYLFLLKILSQEVTLDYLNEGKHYEAETSRLVLIQGCIKSCVQHRNENDKNHLTIALSRLDLVKALFDTNGADSSNPRFVDFLCAIEEKYKSCKTFLERKEKKDQAATWFNPLSDVLHAFSKSISSSSLDRDIVLNVYHTSGLIFQHCSRILYVTGKSGIISQMLDTLILPRSIYSTPDKALHPNLLRALGLTLHMYLKSLLYLDYKRDSYLQRVLSNIFNIYVTRFHDASVASHPFVKVLLDPHLSDDQIISVMKFLKDCTDDSKSNETISKVIKILHGWMTNAKASSEIKLPQLLLPLLEKAKSCYCDALMLTKINYLIKFIKS